MSEPFQRLPDRALLDIVALAKDAIGIYTGEDIFIQFANDAMIAFWGRNRSVIGKKLIDAVPELQGQPFIGLLQEVWRTGRTYAAQDVEALLQVNGQLQPFYFDFEYRALLDERGKTYGILHTATEVTARMKTMQLVQEKEEREQALIEELKAINEELTLLNEEYTALNEELSASNEQLLLSEGVTQHLNETLNTTIVRLAESEDRLSFALESAGIGVWDLDVQNSLVIWDDRTKELYGFSKDDIVPYEQVLKYIHPDDMLKVNQAVAYALNPASGGFYNIRFRTIGAEDGQIRWLHCKGKAYFNEDGQPYRFSGTAQDVSAEKKAQHELEAAHQQLLQAEAARQEAYRQLAESEQRLRKVFEQAPLALSFLSGPNQVFELINDQLLRLINKDSSIIGKPYAEVRPEPEVAPYLRIMQEVYQTGQAFVATEQKVFINDELEDKWGYFNFTYQPIKDEQGNTTSILTIAENVTDTVEARLENERVSRQLQIAVEAAHIGSWQINPKTMQMEYSAALAKLLGYTHAAPLTYEKILEQIEEEYREPMDQAVRQALITGGDYNFMYPQHRFDTGELIWVRSVGKVITNQQNEPVSFTGIVMDITGQKQEEQRKSDFIGIVSHELRSPLTSMSGYVQMMTLKAKKSEDPTMVDIAAKARRQIDRMSALIKGFLDVARMNEGKIAINRTYFDMAGLVKQAEDESLATVTTHQVIFHPVEYTPIEADHDKIEQVIINFINNAVKYSPPGSDINVSCVSADKQVKVSVGDSGMGISPQDQQHIFDRFYRVESEQTKTVKGFGIGLYICKEIIERHGGQIGVESEIGKGSTFWFSLPL